jgi:hypothetical protein
LGDKNYNFPCIGFKSIEDLKKEYKLVNLDFKEDTRVVNDIDIFNRQFPPIKIREDEVLLFEKKD